MVGRTMDNIDHQLVVQFFQFVEGLHDGVLFRGAVKLKTWMNCHAKTEASHYGFPMLVRFSVGNFAEVSECCHRIKTHAATYVRVNRLDLQASLDLSISNDKLCGLLFEALCPTHAPIERTSVLGRLQFAAMITKAFCTLNRGDELRDLTLGMCFVRMLETIGNYGGTDCGHFVSNKAKENQVGNLMYKAFAQHINPLQDPAAWDGIVLLQRFVSEREPFPIFTDWDDFGNRPLYGMSHIISFGSRMKQ
jgi:hypothetical protein